MWIGIGIVLLILWAGGFFAFHVAGFFIHILLLLAVASIIIHFISGSLAAVKAQRAAEMKERRPWPPIICH